jgi:hypothetical protein
MNSPAALRHAGRLWAHRAVAELDAAARFARLLELLRAAGARAVVVDMARAAVDDEHRHHTRCVALANRFGIRVDDTARAPAPALAAGLRTAVEQALYETVAMSCVTESLSTALLMEIRAAAADDEVAATVDEILRDEVDHARLGWAHLAAEAPRRDLGFLGPRLPAILAHTVHEEIFATDDGGPLALEVAGLGGLPRPRRRAVLVQSMHDVVFPGLRHHGVDTSAAEHWLAKRVA